MPKFETKVIHAGQHPEPTTGAVMQPVFQTSTYAQPWPAKHTGYEYARTQNPTREALERCVAALAHDVAEQDALVHAHVHTLRAGQLGYSIVKEVDIRHDLGISRIIFGAKSTGRRIKTA